MIILKNWRLQHVKSTFGLITSYSCWVKLLWVIITQWMVLLQQNIRQLIILNNELIRINILIFKSLLLFKPTLHFQTILLAKKTIVVLHQMLVVFLVIDWIDWIDLIKWIKWSKLIVVLIEASIKSIETLLLLLLRMKHRIELLLLWITNATISVVFNSFAWYKLCLSLSYHFNQIFFFTELNFICQTIILHRMTRITTSVVVYSWTQTSTSSFNVVLSIRIFNIVCKNRLHRINGLIIKSIKSVTAALTRNAINSTILIIMNQLLLSLQKAIRISNTIMILDSALKLRQHNFILSFHKLVNSKLHIVFFMFTPYNFTYNIRHISQITHFN